jgi:hypothetical protein
MLGRKGLEVELFERGRRKPQNSSEVQDCV